MKYMKRALSLFIALALAVTVQVAPISAKAAASKTSTVTAVTKRGNTPSNLAEGGYMASDSQWVYYYSDGIKLRKADISLGPSPKYLGIYAQRLDGKGETRKVVDFNKNEQMLGGFSNFCVYDGWLYYEAQKTTARDPETGYATAIAAVIARSKVDGTGSTQLIFTSGDILKSNTNLNRFIIADGWIYYSLSSIEDDSKNTYIYRMRLDGKGKEKLTQTIDACFDVCGEWLYFLKYGGQYGAVITRKKLTEANKFENVYSPPFYPGSFFTEGNYMYIKANDTFSRIPLKKNVVYEEVKNLAKLSEDTLMSYVFAVGNGWLFYDDKNILYRVQIDGKNKKKVCTQEEFSYNGMQILNGYLYSPQGINSINPMTVRLKISELK